MKQISFLMIISIITSCGEYVLEQNDVIYKGLESEFQLDTNINFVRSMSAAYAYSFMYPETFREEVDTLNPQIGNTSYKSENGEAEIKLFIEGLVRRDQGVLTEEEIRKEKIALIEYGQAIETGNLELSNNLRITKSHKDFNNARLQFIGVKDKNEIIWGIELSEIPVSGDLIFKNMYFEYPIEQKEYYNPIGIEMLKGFGYSLR